MIAEYLDAYPLEPKKRFASVGISAKRSPALKVTSSEYKSLKNGHVDHPRHVLL